MSIMVSQAGVVNVFLDNGSGLLAGSSNTTLPFPVDSRDASWDVSAAAENGLADIGAAVMSVRMVTFNLNANSRKANGGFGYGLAVDTGANVKWMDGNTGEAALFQLSFYSDVAKTSEITGLDITFKSIISRVQNGNTIQAMDAFAGSGAVVIGGTATLDSNVVKIGDVNLNTGNDAANSFASESGLLASNDALDYYTMNGTDAITFGENDSFWVRRRNLDTVNSVYQLGAVTFDIIPEPATLGLFGVAAFGLLMARRLRI